MGDPLESITAGVKGLGEKLQGQIATGLGDIKNTASGHLSAVTGEFEDLTKKAKGLLPGQNAPVAPPAPVAPAAGGRRRRSRKSKKSTRKGSSKKRSSKKGKKRSTKKRVRFSRRK